MVVDTLLGFGSDSIKRYFNGYTFNQQYHFALPDQEERLRGSALKESREKELHGRHGNGDAALFHRERLGKLIHDEGAVEKVEKVYRENSIFPPPLPSLSVLSLKSHKQNGRFVLQCRKKTQQHIYFVRTYREDGRLKGNLVVARHESEAPLALFRQWSKR